MKSTEIFQYYNLENIIDIYDGLKEFYLHNHGLFNDDNSANFVTLILRNVIESNSEDHSNNYYDDV